eukprot:CAMPEP_0182855976 /NCGR_PEP_ID=MMETSP0034_2-20130328/2168_1 /TAXON_ID=156128 /ORGANISM="Nephroselmis pyriformis, Strain CCMP717" /LENGTH=91 /DNA_ID=CAMNT_0024987009 /DNA_START=237 /DNA_END=508 /DNA_ORIENTATION=+
MVVDLLLMDVVYQSMIWFNTPLEGDSGEAHTCEHLLLGKGKRGRTVASMEAMSLSSSTAFTCRTRTCYTFNTLGGQGAFLELLEAKVGALL